MEALEAVELTNTGSKKAKNFSLGMQQRLGIAMTLLGEPEFLFLDEPINGLDPAGIIEMRKLLKKLNQERGITILISSHMLSELYQLATCYGFLHNGKMLEQITANDLRKKCKKYLYVKVDNAAKATTVLRTKFQLQNLEMVSDSEINVYGIPNKLKTEDINKVLVLEGIDVKAVTAKNTDLDEYYLSLIGKKCERSL